MVSRYPDQQSQSHLSNSSSNNNPQVVSQVFNQTSMHQAQFSNQNHQSQNSVPQYVSQNQQHSTTYQHSQPQYQGSFGSSQNNTSAANPSQYNATLPQTQNCGADLHLFSLRDSFKQAANSLTEFYKQSSNSYNVAYAQGRQDAFDEVAAWLLQQTNQNAHQKNVSMTQFKQFIDSKMAESGRVDQEGFQMPQPTSSQNNLQTVNQQQTNAQNQTHQQQNQAQHQQTAQQVAQQFKIQSRLAPGIMSMKVQDSRKRTNPANQTISNSGIIASIGANRMMQDHKAEILVSNNNQQQLNQSQQQCAGAPNLSKKADQLANNTNRSQQLLCGEDVDMIEGQTINNKIISNTTTNHIVDSLTLDQQQRVNDSESSTVTPTTNNFVPIKRIGQ